MKRYTPFLEQVSPPLSPNRTCEFPCIRLSMHGVSRGWPSQACEGVERRPELVGSRAEPLVRVGIPSVRYACASVWEVRGAALPKELKLNGAITPIVSGFRFGLVERPIGADDEVVCVAHRKERRPSSPPVVEPAVGRVLRAFPRAQRPPSISLVDCRQIDVGQQQRSQQNGTIPGRPRTRRRVSPCHSAHSQSKSAAGR